MNRQTVYVIVTLCSLIGVSKGQKRQPRIIFNDDAQMLMETPRSGAVDFVKGWLDREAAAVPFTTYVFLAATPDICTYDTKVGETYADRLGPDYAHSWAPGIRALRKEKTDVLKVVTKQMKAKGKEVLAAIRMSDTHHTIIGHTHPLCPQFTIDNRHFVIKQPDGRKNETALDYSYPEVRAHRLKIMKEIVEEYDVDGLELNFVRWAKHFPRDKGREKAHIMTDYIGKIHATMAEAAKKRMRKKLTLGVRVPESIAACWLAGVDIKTWVKKGWIDYVVISTWNNTDPQLRVDEFSRFTKPAKVDTVVVMGNMIGTIYAGAPKVLDRPVAMSANHAANSYQAMLLNASEARGAAANYYAYGADSISFWNVGIHFGGKKTAAPKQQERMASWTNAVKSVSSVYAGSRTYRYLPMGKGMYSRRPPTRNYPWYDEGKTPLGHVCSPVLIFSKDKRKQRQVFPFLMADGRNGEKLEGKLTFWFYHLDDSSKLKVDINGKVVPTESVKHYPAGKRRGGIAGHRIEIPLNQCPPFRGPNELGLTLQEHNQGSKDDPYMEELEIVVTSGVRKEKTSSNRPKKKIKILIAVDSEGPTKVNEYWARNRKEGDPKLLEFRRFMTDDVNAAILGCFDGGADEVYVKDDGFRDKNLLLDELDPRAKIMRPSSRLLGGLDSSFSGVMLVGLHAMEGAKKSVLAHTWSSSRRRRYWFNGKEGGEVAAYAIVAGHDHNVPIIFASGCDGLCREVHRLLGEGPICVSVKRALGDGEIQLDPPEKTFPNIRMGAQTAMLKISRCKPYRVSFPLRVKLQLKDDATTAGYETWRRKNKPGWPGKRVGKNIIEAELSTTQHIIL